MAGSNAVREDLLEDEPRLSAAPHEPGVAVGLPEDGPHALQVAEVAARDDDDVGREVERIGRHDLGERAEAGFDARGKPLGLEELAALVRDRHREAEARRDRRQRPPHVAAAEDQELLPRQDRIEEEAGLLDQRRVAGIEGPKRLRVIQPRELPEEPSRPLPPRTAVSPVSRRFTRSARSPVATRSSAAR